MKNKIVIALTVLSTIFSPLMLSADIVSLQPLVVSEKVSMPVAPNPLTCFDFTRSLKMGSKSYDVRALQYALMKEGFNINTAEYGVFGTDTFAGVNGFQTKYASEILTNGSIPTGMVGKMTRTKLNSLYSCSLAPSMPMPVLAEACTASLASMPMMSSISCMTRSGSAAGKSILLSTGTTSTPNSVAV